MREIFCYEEVSPYEVNQVGLIMSSRVLLYEVRKLSLNKYEVRNKQSCWKVPEASLILDLHGLIKKFVSTTALPVATAFFAILQAYGGQWTTTTNICVLWCV